MNLLGVGGGGAELSPLLRGQGRSGTGARAVLGGGLPGRMGHRVRPSWSRETSEEQPIPVYEPAPPQSYTA